MSPMTTVHILTVVMSLFLCCFSSIIRHELHLSALRSSLTILYNCKDIIQVQVILQSVDPLPLEIVIFLFLCVNGLYPDQPNLLNIQLKPSKGRMVGVEAGGQGQYFKKIPFGCFSRKEEYQCHRVANLCMQCFLLVRAVKDKIDINEEFEILLEGKCILPSQPIFMSVSLKQ